MNTNSYTFPELLNTILQYTNKLRDLLEQENETLVNRETEDLETLVKEKLRLVSELNHLTKRQDEFLQSKNLPMGKQGLYAFVSRNELPENEQKNLVSLWAQVRQATEQCQTINESNALTIELLNRHINRSLDVLRGITNRADSLYDPSGNQPHQSQSISIAAV